ncbi:MAG: hypothetical protein KatS3mg111_2345 [Pirellulaceae bacterium]|nr:MAG: hypothetical protein KatS3mg111_2345 [Pirellulaceae bacterium]
MERWNRVSNTESTRSRRMVVCSQCQTPGIIDFSRPQPPASCGKCGQLLWCDGLVDLANEFDCSVDAILPDVSALDRDGVLHALARTAGSALGWTEAQQQELADALRRRESLGSTGLGRGVAIPHASLEWIERPVAVVAHAARPVPFAAIDGVPVHTFVLVVSTKKDREHHVATMERFTRMLRCLVNWC